MKKLKRYFALFLCVMMVSATGLSVNAASFSFYVDAAGDSSTSDAARKVNSLSYTTLTFSTFLYNGPSGGLLSYVLDTDTQKAATSTYALTSGGSKTWSYKSGYGNIMDINCVYGATTASCGYGAQLGGTWTP